MQVTGEAISRHIQACDEWIPAGEGEDVLHGSIILNREGVGALATYLRSLEMSLARQRDRANDAEFRLKYVRHWWSRLPGWLRWTNRTLSPFLTQYLENE